MSKNNKGKTNLGIVNIFRGYYLEDCDCSVCQYHGRRGCKLKKCCCEEEKRDAVANGRIKRKWGALIWDG